MMLDERTYSTDQLRPRPEIFREESGSLLIIATPWGRRSSAKRAIETIKNHFLSSRNDMDSTSPFSKLTCLSPIANDLRIAVKLSNDLIYTEENRDEYLSGIELFVLAKGPNEPSWVQVGFPFPLLDRPGQPLVPLGLQMDLSTEFNQKSGELAPLPNRLLGLDPTSDFSVETIRPQEEDRLILISHSMLPNEIYQLSQTERSVDNISQILSQHYSNTPYWIGSINLK